MATRFTPSITSTAQRNRPSIKSIPIVGVLALASLAAHATKPCEELKSEIAAKLDVAGVKNYVLSIVENEGVGAAKVVGSCDGGSRKITYAKK